MPENLLHQRFEQQRDPPSRVRRIITTVAGLTAPTGPSRTGGFNGDGSPATSLQLNRPVGLAASPTRMQRPGCGHQQQRLRQVAAAVSFAVSDQFRLANKSQWMAKVRSPRRRNSECCTWNRSTRCDRSRCRTTAPGTRYLSTGSVNASSGCATPRQNVTVNLKTQYSLDTNARSGRRHHAARTPPRRPAGRMLEVS